MFAVQAEGADIVTVEGWPRAGSCTAAGGLRRASRPPVRVLYAGHADARLPAPAGEPNPTEDEIRWGLSGNICRCTGYQNIVKAVHAAAEMQSVKEAAE